MQLQLPTLAATQQFAGSVAAAVVAAPPQLPLTIALTGNLGAGKTQWARFFCSALGIASEDITSPTYVLLQRYLGQRMVYHIDFYRLESLDQVWDLGIDELFEQSAITLIEWADKFPTALPDDHLQIRFEQHSDGARSALINATGPHARRVLESVDCL